jgi:hypothetical protein
MENNEKSDFQKRTENRLAMGEAHMICSECGAKLYSFDGHMDSSRPCPYQKSPKGECTDKLKDRY